MTAAPGLEAITVSEFIYDTLTQDDALMALLDDDPSRVAAGTLPFGSLSPGVRFTVLPPVDVKVVGMTQVFSRVTFDAVVTGEGTSYGPLVPVYQRVHELLEGEANRQTPQGLVLTCSRVSGIIYPERDQGVEYRHLGGTYATEAL